MRGFGKRAFEGFSGLGAELQEDRIQQLEKEGIAKDLIIQMLEQRKVLGSELLEKEHQHKQAPSTSCCCPAATSYPISCPSPN